MAVPLAFQRNALLALFKEKGAIGADKAVGVQDVVGTWGFDGAEDVTANNLDFMARTGQLKRADGGKFYLAK